MKRLDEIQKRRLTEILNKQLHEHSVREIADIVGCSIGSVSEISAGVRKSIPESLALSICKGLDINPYYILEGQEPKYAKWSETFSAPLQYV